MLDVVFSVGITGSLVVFVWRGSWVFLDRKLFPENEVYSAWGSLVIYRLSLFKLQENAQFCFTDNWLFSYDYMLHLSANYGSMFKKRKTTFHQIVHRRYLFYSLFHRNHHCMERSLEPS